MNILKEIHTPATANEAVAVFYVNVVTQKIDSMNFEKSGSTPHCELFMRKDFRLKFNKESFVIVFPGRARNASLKLKFDPEFRIQQFKALMKLTDLRYDNGALKVIEFYSRLYPKDFEEITTNQD